MTRTEESVRAAFALACPGTRVRGVTAMDVGYTSKQWLFDTDEGPLMLKIPVRKTDPEHLRNLIAATRVAAELDLPVSRYRAFLPVAEPVDAPVVVQEFAAGRRASDHWKELAPDVRREAAATLGRWVGTLHTRRSTEFTDVLGNRGYPSVAEHVRQSLDEALATLRDAGIDVDLDTLRQRLEQGAAEFGAVEPTFCHHDFYLDNVLLDENGHPSRLLDFEHARFSDQFAEFGKISELLFGWYPETEEPFRSGYQELHELDDAAHHRIDVHCGLYNVLMCAYFSEWTPNLVPEYIDRINSWLSR